MIFKKILLLAILSATGATLHAQDIPVIKFSHIKKLQQAENDTTYIINFWATWCKPCVQELPYFDALTNKYEGRKIKVVLVSLDFKRELPRLEKFVADHKVISQVLLLDEPDYNSWIPLVDKSWSGAIPATLIINNKNGIRKFYEQEFSEEEINKITQSFLY